MPSLFDHARTDPQRVALRFPDQGISLDYHDFATEAAQAAAWMLELGLDPGDVVALLCDNRPALLAFAFGARRCGLYFTPISTHLKPRELSHVLADSRARVLVVAPSMVPLAHAVLGGTAQPELGCFLLPDDTAMPESAMPAARAFPLAMPYQPVSTLDAHMPPLPLGRDFLYSSGTTGLPSGIRKPMLSWEQRHQEDPEITAWRRFFAFDAGSVYYSAAPLHHAAPFRYAMRVLEVGGTCVIADRFDPKQALVTLTTEHVTHSQWVPTMFVRMLALPPWVRAQWTPRAMKLAIHAAAPCPRDVKRNMIEWWGPIISEYYGGSEGAGLTAIDSGEWLAHPGSVGRAKLGRLHITGDDGRVLSPGQDGQVWFEGGPRFEYFGDPEKTARAYSPEGWASYGDIGHVDADGYLYLSERRTDLILSGGANVYPTEVEQVLCMHPLVEDAAVVGQPHADMGAVVRAVVKLAPGATAADALRDDLIAHCRTQLSSIKVPRTLEFRDELPRLENGKLLRRRLLEEGGAPA